MPMPNQYFVNTNKHGLPDTDKRFEVTHTEKMDINDISTPGMLSVPVVLRYEFNLHEQGLADGPLMTARFSRSLGPAFKQTVQWQGYNPSVQKLIESNVAKEENIKPFSHLRFENPIQPNSLKLFFCFLRKEGSQLKINNSPPWSCFTNNTAGRAVLEEVSNKMDEVFKKTFYHVESAFELASVNKYQQEEAKRGKAFRRA